jgi:uncharacterized protein (TIRG00374 family)
MITSGRGSEAGLIRGLVISASLAAAGYLIFAVWAGWDEIVGAARLVGWGGLAIAIALALVNYVLRFGRWQIFLSSLGHAQPAWPSFVIYIAGFALTTTPGKAGELVRGVFLQRRHVPYMQSTAAFFSERLSDLLAVVLLALPGLGADTRVRLLVITGAVLVFGLMYLLTRVNWLISLKGWFAAMNTRVTRMISHMFDLLIVARSCHVPKVLFAATLLSVLAWSAEALAFHLVLEWTGAQISILQAFSIYALSMLAGALSFMPGGLGGTEAVMIALLIALGVNEPQAVVATIVIRLATLWFAVALGVFAMVAGGGLLPPAREQAAA